MSQEGRRLRGISGEEAVRVFERLGYRRRKGKGSHINLVKAASPRLTIPLHGELSVGLLLHEIRKAGLSIQEFLEALGG
ncbi:MAG: type II toxin-antitoxin system HicA family toxin [Chloroflexi bacterium]|nr:type II toxin-antitoxin system HicA family toxin [Chloroflexota bacterium]